MLGNCAGIGTTTSRANRLAPLFPSAAAAPCDFQPEAPAGFKVTTVDILQGERYYVTTYRPAHAIGSCTCSQRPPTTTQGDPPCSQRAGTKNEHTLLVDCGLVPGGAINPLWQAPALREACQTNLVRPLPIGLMCGFGGFHGGEVSWRLRCGAWMDQTDLQLAAGSWEPCQVGQVHRLLLPFAKFNVGRWWKSGMQSAAIDAAATGFRISWPCLPGSLGVLAGYSVLGEATCTRLCTGVAMQKRKRSKREITAGGARPAGQLPVSIRPRMLGGWRSTGCV